MAEGHNTWEIIETLFAAVGRHSSLWPKAIQRMWACCDHATKFIQVEAGGITQASTPDPAVLPAQWNSLCRTYLVIIYYLFWDGTVTSPNVSSSNNGHGDSSVSVAREPGLFSGVGHSSSGTPSPPPPPDTTHLTQLSPNFTYQSLPPNRPHSPNNWEVTDSGARLAILQWITKVNCKDARPDRISLNNLKGFSSKQRIYLQKNN